MLVSVISLSAWHFNPRTPCGVRLAAFSAADSSVSISIHAPLAGCDRTSGRARRGGFYFNPRTPCGVRPPAAALGKRIFYFNPRTPCGVRRPDGDINWEPVGFQSTHPLRGATWRETLAKPRRLFQSTHPLRGATLPSPADSPPRPISIHAPLAGCDSNRSLPPSASSISIHAPLAGCDARCRELPCKYDGFQSTHPLRGATSFLYPSLYIDRISIHAPLAGCDWASNSFFSSVTDFNPRTPCGVRRARPEASSG